MSWGQINQTKAAKKKFMVVGTMDQASHFIRCSQDPWYFIMNFVKIIHPILGRVPFHLFPFQVAVLKVFLQQKYTVTLKPRQMGMSTIVCAYALWMLLFRPHSKILIVSIKQDVATAMLRKVKEMYRNLPDFLKVQPTSGDYDDPGTTTRLELVNGSEIQAVAATENAGRSEALTLLIMDEVAFQANASMIWGAAQQTLATGGQAILISTAFGMGNFFSETWTNAVQGLNGFFPIKLDWKMHPERGQAWYDEQSKLLGAKRTAQEIDCDFLKSGYNVFDMATIRALDDKLKYEVFPIRKEMDGNLLVYAEPDPNKYYYLGADVATGRSRDYSTFSIMDAWGNEVCCFKGKIGVREFGHLLIKWGYYYNGAMLAPEINSIGEGVLVILQEMYYDNLYYRVSMTKARYEHEKEENLYPGWATNSKTRSEMIAGMDDDLTQGTVNINNPFFVQEAYSFVYDESNKPIAIGKKGRSGSGNSAAAMYQDENSMYNDDAIIGSCIANEVRKNPGLFRGMLGMSS